MRPTDYVGCIVRSRRRLSNGYATFRAGALFACTYSRSGLSLSSAPCSSCGISLHISKVPVRDVEVIGRFRERPSGRNPSIGHVTEEDWMQWLDVKPATIAEVLHG